MNPNLPFLLSVGEMIEHRPMEKLPGWLTDRFRMEAIDKKAIKARRKAERDRKRDQRRKNRR